MTSLPAIKIINGIVTAGPYTLQPARKDWKHKRTFWRALLEGKPVTGFTFSPALALAEAVRKSPPPSTAAP